MSCSRSDQRLADQRLAVAAVALLCVLQLPNQVLAHAKGFYKTPPRPSRHGSPGRRALAADGG
jgi:hypothetical protein